RIPRRICWIISLRSFAINLGETRGFRVFCCFRVVRDKSLLASEWLVNSGRLRLKLDAPTFSARLTRRVCAGTAAPRVRCGRVLERHDTSEVHRGAWGKPLIGDTQQRALHAA